MWPVPPTPGIESASRATSDTLTVNSADIEGSWRLFGIIATAKYLIFRIVSIVSSIRFNSTLRLLVYIGQTPRSPNCSTGKQNQDLIGASEVRTLRWERSQAFCATYLYILFVFQDTAPVLSSETSGALERMSSKYTQDLLKEHFLLYPMLWLTL